MKQIARNLGVLAALLFAASACTPVDQGPAATDVVATKGTAPQRIVIAAGIGDFASVQSSTSDVDATVVTSVGTSALLYNSGLGAGNFANIGLGVISILAAKPQSLAAFDAVLASYPASSSATQVAADIQNRLIKTEEASLRSAGYQKVADPKHPGQMTFIRPGCQITGKGSYDASCSEYLTIFVDPRGRDGSNRVYRVFAGNSKSLRNANPVPIKGAYEVAFRAVDRAKGVLSLYIAPRKASGGWSEPFLYYKGKTEPLITG